MKKLQHLDGVLSLRMQERFLKEEMKRTLFPESYANAEDVFGKMENAEFKDLTAVKQ